MVHLVFVTVELRDATTLAVSYTNKLWGIILDYQIWISLCMLSFV